MVEKADREDTQTGWRYGVMVLARMAAIPFMLGLVVESFCLAVTVYAHAPAWGRNAQEVLGLLSIFGGVSFLAALGMAQLKNQLASLLKVWAVYVRSVFDRSSASAKESAVQMAKSLLPILCLAFIAGLLRSHTDPSLAGTDPPTTVPVMTDAGDLTITKEDLEGGNAALHIEGLEGELDRMIGHVFARFRESETGTSASRGYDRGNWKTSNYVASFPVVFERANLESIAPAGAKATIAQGVAYDAERNAHLIENLVEALAPCGESDGTRPVWLSVRGSASSAPFKQPDGTRSAQSDELNVRVANARRRNVEEALRTAIRHKQFTSRIMLVATLDYERPEQLKRDRLLVDRPVGETDDGESKPQDYLTRAAYIHVLSAANCAPD